MYESYECIAKFDGNFPGNNNKYALCLCICVSITFHFFFVLLKLVYFTRQTEKRPKAKEK